MRAVHVHPRDPEQVPHGRANVRTGCLKALSFVFEYIGPQSAYYVDSVVTILEDALMDRDLVH